MTFSKYDDDLLVFRKAEDITDLLIEFKLVWDNARPWGEELVEPEFVPSSRE